MKLSSVASPLFSSQPLLLPPTFPLHANTRPLALLLEPRQSVSWAIQHTFLVLVSCACFTAHVCCTSPLPCVHHSPNQPVGGAPPTTVENVREHLSSPGQWYLDRAAQL